jgi:L-2-hydroxyglutarate oxidase LhgO
VQHDVDVAIVGAGIVGLATARQLLLDRPGLRVAVLEKEAEPGRHQTGRNSGVLHSGVYYTPGSLKARLCVEGKRRLEAYAAERGIPVERRGKLIVALDASELPRLAELERRARANGVPDLKVLDGDALREVEPHVLGIRALHVPTTGVIDYGLVARAYADDVREAGGTIACGRRVTAIRPGAGAVAVDAGETLTARLVVTCAGVQSDRVGGGSGTRIVPFRGDYYTLTGRTAGLVRGLVYPVPDPAFPFLGVHFTRRIDGTVIAGPNAVLALAREGYGRTSFSLRDALDTLRHPGFRRFAVRHWRLGLAETWRDWSKRAFVADMRRYLPDLDADEVRFGPSGIRAQAMDGAGRLVDDFVIDEGERVLRVVNAPSPAATSSLAIGEHLAGLAARAID